jgi:glycosyltransferase involved in cell wall biosynthesis
MTRIRKLLERGAWQLRHKAASCLSVLEEGLILIENRVQRSQDRLIILDETFPSLTTGFRVAEFNAILERFPSAIVYSSRPSRRDYRRYAAVYPQSAPQVRRFSPRRKLSGSAAYVVFLNNICAYLEKIEEARLPFAFELYPGGGLCLDDTRCDTRLSRVFGSPMFRRVIVTQNVTRDYVLRKGFCRPEQIEFVFGVVAPSNMLHDSQKARSRFGLNKRTVDICFIAYKYMPGGLDKGYDRFLATARVLSGRHSQVRFHVVGELTEQDADVRDLRDRISFYGHQPTSFFPDFHSRMDLILSPNVPFVFGPGKFDGFPTGCCIEAALCGTAIFATDELGMNEGRLRDGEEIVIISREPGEIAETVERYIADPERLASLAQNGQRAIRRMFSLDAQMSPRLRVLSDLLDGARMRSG